MVHVQVPPRWALPYAQLAPGDRGGCADGRRTPLVDRPFAALRCDRILSPESLADADAFVGYVRRRGPIKTIAPTLAGAFWLSRMPSRPHRYRPGRAALTRRRRAGGSGWPQRACRAAEPRQLRRC